MPDTRNARAANHVICRSSIQARGRRLYAMLAVALVLALNGLLGCNGDDSSESGTNDKGLPAEYRTVAGHLAQELKPDPSAFQDDKGLAEIISEGHSAVMDLRSIETNDSDLAYIATQGEAACLEAVARMERINALPKPQGAGSLFVESFIHGLYGNVYAGYALGAEADARQKAIFDEVTALAAAVDRLDSAHQLLPKVARKYSAPTSTNSNRVRVDFDESWYGWGPYDWCCLYNSGDTLRDCTVVVTLTGDGGQTRTNVHWVDQWPTGSWMYARYDPGTEINGRAMGRMTVTQVNTVKVTILSPTFSTVIDYTYAGAEKDRDIAERVKNMKLSWRYQPFESGLIWDTQRSVKLTLADYPYLGPCRVDVTFKRGSDSKSWYWELDSWKQGEEKTLAPPAGGLPYDPDAIGVVISFPGTAHTMRWDLKVR